MTVLASSIIHRVVDLLQDTAGVRWTTGELVRWLNDGQREAAMYRPDLMSVNATITCVAGSRQAIPPGGRKLFRVIRNTATKRSIRLVDRDVLDSVMPTWQSAPESEAVKNYTFDHKEPDYFYVYPPAKAQLSLDIMYEAPTSDIAEPGGGTTYADVTGNISLPDSVSNCLIDYTLHRTYLKNSKVAGNLALAQAHYLAFTNALGVEAKGLIASAPEYGAGIQKPRAAAA